MQTARSTANLDSEGRISALLSPKSLKKAGVVPRLNLPVLGLGKYTTEKPKIFAVPKNTEKMLMANEFSRLAEV